MAPPLPASLITRDRGDNRYLKLIGGTLSGKLTVNAGGLAVTGQTDVFGSFYVSQGSQLNGITNTGNITNNGANIFIQNDGNGHLWFKTAAGVDRGLLYSASGDRSLRMNVYGAAGSQLGSAGLYTDGSWRTSGVLMANDATVQVGYDGASYFKSTNVSAHVQIRLRNGLTPFYWDSIGTIYLARETNQIIRSQIGALHFQDAAGTNLYRMQGSLGADIDVVNRVLGDARYVKRNATDLADVYSGAGAGGVGTYAFLRFSGSFALGFGNSVGGADLNPANASGAASGNVTGSWRCMGYSGTPDQDDRTTLYFRHA